MVQKSASAYERHQQILQLLIQADSLRVNDLAQQLDVSESTIRTDLEALDEQGWLIRVRGGAVAKKIDAPHSSLTPQNDFEHKINQNIKEKQSIARWAATMINDDDIIMFDSSSTVLHIAHYLKDRRNLTVITNGLYVAQLMAKEPSNTVIILGGILRSNGNSLTGTISKQILHDYHIQRAFVSCSGFKPDVGFLESNLQEVEIKALMIQSAAQRFALFDGSKIGQASLSSFASLNDMDYVVVDSGVDEQVIQKIHKSGTEVVICDEKTTYIYGDPSDKSTTFRIGFANLSEKTSFSRDVRRGLENAARENSMIDLVLADNDLDKDVAVQVAEHLLSKDLDLIIEYQIDEETGNLIAHKIQSAGIPLVAVDIPMVGATYFGVDNYQAGNIAGKELGKVVNARWHGNYDNLIIVEQSRTGKLPAMRIHGQIEGFSDMVGAIDVDKVITADFDNTSESSYSLLVDLMQTLPLGSRLAVICFNDDGAVGALRAARHTGHIDNLLLVGQGADRRMRDEMRANHKAVVGATAFFPEKYGEHLIAIALDILNGKPVSPAVYMKHVFVNPKNVNTLYQNDLDDTV